MTIAVVSLEKIKDPNPIGGIENVIYRLTKYARKYEKVDLFNLNSDNSKLFKLLREYEFVHFYASPLYKLRMIARCSWLKKYTKIGVTYYLFQPPGFGKKIFRKFVLSKFVDTIFVHSKRLEELYKGFNSNTNFLIPPVTQEFFDIYKKRDPQYVCYIGRFSYDKGFDRLSKFKNIVYSGYTNRGSKDFYKIISKNELKIINKPPTEILKRAKVLILPYRSLENSVDIPLLVLEAMAAGIPVLTSNMGDLPTILPEECIFEKNAEIEEKVRYLASNFYEIGDALHERADELNCHIKAVGKEYVDIISQYS